MSAKFEEMDLRALKERYDRQMFLQAGLEGIDERIAAQQKLCDKLRTKLVEEEKDVTEIQTGSVKGFFKTAFRDKAAILEREAQEFEAAETEYREAAAALEELRRNNELWSRELTGLAGCAEVFLARYEARKAELESLGGDVAAKIFAAEERVTAAKAQLNQIQETYVLARKTRVYIQKIEQNLSNAQDPVSDWVKRDFMNKAERMVPELQIKLEQLNEQLKGLAGEGENKISDQGVMRYADYFYNGPIIEFGVHGQIHGFKERMFQLRLQIFDAKQWMNALREETEHEIRDAEDALKRSVVEA